MMMMMMVMMVTHHRRPIGIVAIELLKKNALPSLVSTIGVVRSLPAISSFIWTVYFVPPDTLATSGSASPKSPWMKVIFIWLAAFIMPWSPVISKAGIEPSPR